MKLKRTHIISFANQKGGCGKTTAAVSIAAAFNRLGYSACLVDTDPQCNSTDNFVDGRDKFVEEGKFTLADVYLAKKAARDAQMNVDGNDENTKNRPMLVAGHRGLGSVEKRLETHLQAQIADSDSSPLDADDFRNDHRSRLKKSLDTLRGIHDFIVIDTPPDLGFLMTTALMASDWYVIPVFPSGYDLDGLSALTRTADKVRKRSNSRLQLLGVLLGNFDVRAKLDQQIFSLLQRKFGEEFVFEDTISRTVRQREAPIYKRTIFEHAPTERAAENFLAVAKQIINKVEPNQDSDEATRRDEKQSTSPEPVIVTPSASIDQPLEGAVSNG